ncbi:hypothetical protein HK097_005677 [Rhizophlyctis rosea]|uniref:Uncharacterized protein n=1 Tax=Rhizophlyctis rosea TaxID=64517 RepID=A0AAD5SGK0_9FUNG|nr:hypothetical protein HK097_005677 [Rhizophlyctis rosea]
MADQASSRKPDHGNDEEKMSKTAVSSSSQPTWLKPAGPSSEKRWATFLFNDKEYPDYDDLRPEHVTHFFQAFVIWYRNKQSAKDAYHNASTNFDNAFSNRASINTHQQMDTWTFYLAEIRLFFFSHIEGIPYDDADFLAAQLIRNQLIMAMESENRLLGLYQLSEKGKMLADYEDVPEDFGSPLPSLPSKSLSPPLTSESEGSDVSDSSERTLQPTVLHIPTVEIPSDGPGKSSKPLNAFAVKYILPHRPSPPKSLPTSTRRKPRRAAVSRKTPRPRTKNPLPFFDNRQCKSTVPTNPSTNPNLNLASGRGQRLGLVPLVPSSSDFEDSHPGPSGLQRLPLSPSKLESQTVVTPSSLDSAPVSEELVGSQEEMVLATQDQHPQIAASQTTPIDIDEGMYVKAAIVDGMHGRALRDLQIGPDQQVNEERWLKEKGAEAAELFLRKGIALLRHMKRKWEEVGQEGNEQSDKSPFVKVRLGTEVFSVMVDSEMMDVAQSGNLSSLDLKGKEPAVASNSDNQAKSFIQVLGASPSGPPETSAPSPITAPTPVLASTRPQPLPPVQTPASISEENSQMEQAQTRRASQAALLEQPSQQIVTADLQQRAQRVAASVTTQGQNGREVRVYGGGADGEGDAEYDGDSANGEADSQGDAEYDDSRDNGELDSLGDAEYDDSGDNTKDSLKVNKGDDALPSPQLTQLSSDSQYEPLRISHLSTCHEPFQVIRTDDYVAVQKHSYVNLYEKCSGMPSSYSSKFPSEIASYQFKVGKEEPILAVGFQGEKQHLAVETPSRITFYLTHNFRMPDGRGKRGVQDVLTFLKPVPNKFHSIFFDKAYMLFAVDAFGPKRVGMLAVCLFRSDRGKHARLTLGAIEDDFDDAHIPLTAMEGNVIACGTTGCPVIYRHSDDYRRVNENEAFRDNEHMEVFPIHQFDMRGDVHFVQPLEDGMLLIDNLVQRKSDKSYQSFRLVEGKRLIENKIRFGKDDELLITDDVLVSLKKTHNHLNEETLTVSALAASCVWATRVFVGGHDVAGFGLCRGEVVVVWKSGECRILH